MSTDGHTKWGKNTAENFNLLSIYANVTDRRQRDGFTTTYSEREREHKFMFAIKSTVLSDCRKVFLVSSFSSSASEFYCENRNFKHVGFCDLDLDPMTFKGELYPS